MEETFKKQLKLIMDCVEDKEKIIKAIIKQDDAINLVKEYYSNFNIIKASGLIHEMLMEKKYELLKNFVDYLVENPTDSEDTSNCISRLLYITSTIPFCQPIANSFWKKNPTEKLTIKSIYTNKEDEYFGSIFEFWKGFCGTHRINVSSVFINDFIKNATIKSFTTYYPVLSEMIGENVLDCLFHYCKIRLTFIDKNEKVKFIEEKGDKYLEGFPVIVQKSEIDMEEIVSKVMEAIKNKN